MLAAEHARGRQCRLAAAAEKCRAVWPPNTFFRSCGQATSRTPGSRQKNTCVQQHAGHEEPQEPL